MTTRHFPYKLDPRFKFIWWPLGVRHGQGVTIDGDELRAEYGRIRIATPLANVSDGHITEDYQWFKAIGVRLSLADDGLTLGTNTERGACLHFRDPVGGAFPGKRHSAVTVTVEDCEALVQAVGDAQT